MKIQDKLLKVTMFAAVLLGASITTQNVKADTATDSDNADDQANVTVTKNSSDKPLYNGFVNDQTNNSSTADTATQSSANQANTNVSSTSDSDKTTWSDTNQFKPQNDYYDYVNNQWLLRTNVAKDKQDIGTISQTQQSVNDQFYDKFMNYVNGTEHTTDPTMQKAIDFYKLYMSKNYTDTTALSKDSSTRILQEANKINNLQSIDQFSQEMNELLKEGVTFPFNIKVDIDQNNPQLRSLYFYGAAPMLMGDDGQPSDDKQTSETTIAKFLSDANVPFSEIQNIIVNTKKFDQILAKYQTDEDKVTDKVQDGYTGDGINRTTNYLPVSYLNLVNGATFVDLDDLINQMTGMSPGYVFEMTPSFYENFNEIVNPENFIKMKSWMVSNYILNNSSYINQLQNNFPTVANEQTEQFNQRMAYYLTRNAFSDEFSKYFGDVLLTKENKNAVMNMTENIVSAYKDEITNSTWLSDSGKQAALDKLDSIKINVGYPSDSYAYFNQIDIPERGSIYQIYHDILAAKNYQQYVDYQKPVDRTQWGSLSSLETNAQYSPRRNAIFIGTGIIQKPFFDAEQTDPQNYGGLGTILGHEISHAFDKNGSLYDKDGLFDNLWTADDYQNFMKKYNQVIANFDNINFKGISLNGKLTVDENLADSNGLDVAERALTQTTANPNWDQFFRSYARINRHKYYLTSDTFKDDSQELLGLSSDVHSPFPVRVDVNLQNNDIFAKTYNVKPGDGMWIDPDKRFVFWS